MPVYNFNLNANSDCGDTFEVYEGQVVVSCESDIENAIMEHWDDRLTCSGCTPEFSYEPVCESDDFDHIIIGRTYIWTDSENEGEPEKVVVESIDDEFVYCKTKNAGIETCHPEDLKALTSSPVL